MVLASVIIPARAPAKLLRRVLQLIDDQSTDNFELIVVADGNCEAIPLVRDLPLAHPCRLYDSGSSSGTDPERRAFAWNLGAREAHGDWLVFLGDDCFVTRQHLESFVAAFQENTLLVGPVDEVDARDWTKLTATDRRKIFQQDAGTVVDAGELMSAHSSWIANMAVPRRAFMELGGIKEDVHGEIDFCRRFAGQFRKVAVVPAAVRRVEQPGKATGDNSKATIRNGAAGHVMNGSASYADLRNPTKEKPVGDRSPGLRSTSAPATVPQEFGSKTAQLLWSDEKPYEDRLHRCSVALIALARTIERNASLKELSSDFLENFAAVVAADPAIFSQVWSEPLAYSWIHMAYELVENHLHGRPLTELTSAYRTALGATDSGTALTVHLNRFKAFVLGIALLSGEDLAFREPLRVLLPFSVPGTRWVLEGEGTLNIEGTDGFTKDSASAKPQAGTLTVTGVRLVQCPLAQHADCEIRMQPAAVNLPGLKELTPLMALPLDYQQRFAPVFSQALGLIAESQPAVFERMKNHHRIVAFKPEEEGGYGNVSYSELPGAVVLSASISKWLLAEEFLHEFHHNRLFVLEDLGPFFSESQTAAAPNRRFYSPWRSDLRPLKGVFHAVYVFLAQLRYNLGLLSPRQCTPSEREYIVARIRRIVGQLALGLSILERHGRFTPYGQQVLAQMNRDYTELRLRAVQAGVNGDGPAMVVRDDGCFVQERSQLTGEPITAVQAVAEHVRRFDTENHCAGFDLGV